MSTQIINDQSGGLGSKSVQILAQYDQRSQTTIFDCMGRERFINIITEMTNSGVDQMTKARLRDAAVIVHEYRHCVDHLSTLWGQNHLLKMARAIKSILNGGDDIECIRDYKQENSRSFQNDIFINPAIKMSAKQKMLLATIKETRHKHRYVNKGQYSLYIEFYSETQERIVGLPLSVASLLESNAVFEEVMLNLQNLGDGNSDEFVVDVLLHHDELMKGLNNPELALYNVVFQLTWGLFNCPNFLVAYRLASMIATLSLNLPNDLIKCLPIGADNKEADMFQTLLNNQDYGTVFFILSQNYSKTFNGESVDFLSINLDDILKANKLPNKEKLQMIIEHEFAVIANELGKERFIKRFLLCNQVGLTILQYGGLDGFKGTVFEKFRHAKWNPPFATPLDGGGVDYQKNCLIDLILKEDDTRNAIFWYSVSRDLDDIMDEFLGAQEL